MEHSEAMEPVTIEYNKKLKQKRELQIREILSRKKIVRFSFDGYYKDIKEWTLNDVGDLCAFRWSEGVKSPYICWESPCYSIQEIEE